MPIKLNDLAASAAASVSKAYNPKFFSKDLTGSGKKTGLLNENLNPVNAAGRQNPYNGHAPFCGKKTRKNGNTTVRAYGINAAIPRLIKMQVPAFDKNNTVVIASAPRVVQNGIVINEAVEVYCSIEPKGIVIEETAMGPAGGVGKKIFIDYIAKLAWLDPNKTDEDIIIGCNAVYVNVSNPAETKSIDNILDIACANTMSHIDRKYCRHDYKPDRKAYEDYLYNYSVYNEICRLSERWQTGLDKEIDLLIKTAVNDGNIMDVLQRELFPNMEDYNVPLEIYRRIYTSIRTLLPKDVATDLCKTNMNLLLSDTLENLSNNKSKIQTFTPATDPKKLPASYRKLSQEQQKAVSTAEPLVLVQSGAGCGKALPLDEPILTPDGWTTMGKLHIGDEVIGSDGKPVKVTNIYEQGLKSGYKLTFRDGSSVRCCDEHLWEVRNLSRTGEQSRVLTTKEWLESNYKTHGYLPIVQPVEFSEKKLPMDPYLLGALLADGYLAGNAIQYTKSEKTVAEKTAEAAKHDGYEMHETTHKNSTANQWKFTHPDDRPNFSRINTTIRAFGLKHKAHEKFIPKEYFTASVEQRKALVNGLFDGDGSVCYDRGYAQFHTASDQMADDMLQLLWSLGLNAVKIRHGHKHGAYWCVSLLSDWNPFLASSYYDKVTGPKRSIRRSIKSAEPIGTVPMRCIEVDAADKLYVTKDYIVTHNTHVIMQRMDFMKASGVSMNDITVLSFTNAAADNITNRNPGVHSMTIARMIHSIYEVNFPKHELSSTGTLINCIEIYYPANSRPKVVDEFRKRLYDMLHDEKSGYTQMNNFVEKNYSDVIDILDNVGQTTLALEIIICYQQIENLKEPATVRSKYLILDEVQDNSVFEFIYVLKYVDKHNESLFIVGDCSQTLYAFRAANPMAMNILESSGVFATYPLQINFRSNQEILDFANVMLRDIEANQFANIQLQANSLAAVSEQSFRDKVNLHYECLSKIGDWKDTMETCFSAKVRKYIDAKLAAGEQIAFLAFTRFNTYQIQDILKKMYPNRKCVTLVPEKQFDSTLFSAFIKKYWDDIRFAPSAHIMSTISHELSNRLTYMVNNPDKTRPVLQKMLLDWDAQCSGDVAVWYNQYTNGQMTKDVFLENVKESMLKFEINMNAVRQALLSARNAAQKTDDSVKDADFILSTIHSAKGLEFPNTVVIYRDESMMAEEDKRMYYVALTRAMKSEFILAYGTLKNPQIEADYKTVLDMLKAKATAAAKAMP